MLLVHVPGSWTFETGGRWPGSTHTGSPLRATCPSPDVGWSWYRGLLTASDVLQRTTSWSASVRPCVAVRPSVDVPTPSSTANPLKRSSIVCPTSSVGTTNFRASFPFRGFPKINDCCDSFIVSLHLFLSIASDTCKWHIEVTHAIDVDTIDTWTWQNWRMEVIYSIDTFNFSLWKLRLHFTHTQLTRAFLQSSTSHRVWSW